MAKIKKLCMDLETFSEADLPKTGVLLCQSASMTVLTTR